MKFNFKIINLCLVGILGLLVIFKIFLNLSLMDLNYKINELKANLDDLSVKNKILSFRYLKEKEKYFVLNLKEIDLVKNEKIEFVTIKKDISLSDSKSKTE